MEDSLIATRLKAIIEALGLTDSQFADTCSISRPTLSLLLAGKNKKISDVMLSQIHQAFPQVSILWLIFGEGEMFNGEKNTASKDNSETEIAKIPTNGQADDEQLNLVNLKQLENIIKQVIDQSFSSSFKEVENLVLKKEDVKNIRKVNKITVYYDDSTFDTFVPDR